MKVFRPTTQNKVFAFDYQDIAIVNKHKWFVNAAKNDRFYVVCKYKKKSLRLHRLLLGLDFGDKRVVDHIDGNPLNNCRSNLRVCTNTENSRNRGRNKNNTSGLKGVFWNKGTKNWRVQISLGCFSSKEEAYEKYCKVIKELHGEFSNTGDSVD